MSKNKTPKPDYSLFVSRVDFFVFGLAGALYFLSFSLGDKLGHVYKVGGIVIASFVFAVACYLSYANTFGAKRARDIIVRELSPKLKGDEIVLDVGTGSGLILIGLAKLLNNGGKAHGVDIWETERDRERKILDRSLKTPKLTLKNAEIEGVADRVQLLGGDPRNVPYPNDYFDVCCCADLAHHLSKGSLDRTIIQMVRVTKNGGLLVIHDFWHMERTKKLLKKFGMEIEKIVSSSPILPISRCIIARKPVDGLTTQTGEILSKKSKQKPPIELASLSKEEEESLKRHFAEIEREKEK
ncbi:putative type 11 methyltransferase [Monocercomonoides exilis]|uniref:putative type 11 methyltransferase n=1 Tax=Monocercomonoides exilis TaxID=2049356 RepID=UPI00355AB36B|nr:putative type 11 methyltransferase [Monocercomonoides exilis]|eukprot:MONOS_5071.1-p1 / transcript=MONOS_5071.1 / gene=MONOS_5071 / organism=Monocercomonoides_exilis_PA203 / gene_product=type 11 methyltransferase / transcript_product=type 11 methyltransferase / location=Mono_scaffold00144:10341-11430(-) / protein_length=297 / sequence_SO=supercontig / SO=protein_coding / is_pseudo=false